jgi:hypothetical protein
MPRVTLDGGDEAVWDRRFFSFQVSAVSNPTAA